MRHLALAITLMSPTEASIQLGLGAKSAAKTTTDPSQIPSSLASSLPIPQLVSLAAVSHQSTSSFVLFTWMGSRIFRSAPSEKKAELSLAIFRIE
jgi:hypothetical protein